MGSVPGDIGRPGRAFLRQVGEFLKAERWVQDPHEQVILFNAARCVDRLATARAAMATVEATDPTWSRLAREERASMVELRRTIAVLGLPVGLPSGEKLTPSAAGIKAAQARWGRQHAPAG